MPRPSATRVAYRYLMGGGLFHPDFRKKNPYGPRLTKGWAKVLQKDIEDAAVAAVEQMVEQFRKIHGPGKVTQDTGFQAYETLRDGKGGSNNLHREVVDTFWDWLKKNGKNIKQYRRDYDPEFEDYAVEESVKRDSSKYQKYVEEYFDPRALRDRFGEAIRNQIGKTYRG